MLTRLVRALLGPVFRERSRKKAAKPSAPRHGLKIDASIREARNSHQASDYEAAEQKYRLVLDSDPDNADANYLLGKLNGQRGNHSEAVAFLEKAINLKPDFADAHVALGNVFKLLGQTDRATVSYRQALALQPDNVLAHYNLGLLYQEQHKLEQALECLRRAFALQPDLAGLLRSLTVVLVGLEQHDAALGLLRERLNSHPDDAEVHAAMGFVLLKTLKPQASLNHFERVLRLKPDDSETLNNMGIALQDMGRLDEAIAIYDQALAANPDNHLARWHRSLAFLLRGDFSRAWSDYELRLLSESQPKRNFPYPRWDGTDLSGRTILVHAEQGLGDEIMFASCLPDVIARAKHCVIDCNLKLAPIFVRSFPAATIHGGSQFDDLSWLDKLPPVDVQIPSGSLPLFLRNKREDFPAHQGYLRADPERIAFWKERLAALGGGLKVGVSWRGGTRISRIALRSLELPQLAPILTQGNVHFIDLQYNSNQAELSELQQTHGVTIHHWEEAIHNYDETAALICALDRVISVCTAAVHLSGALGRPVWVMAPLSPEWRYGIKDEFMQWYPSVRVFRQTRWGEWDGVIHRIAQELRNIAKVAA